MLETKEKLIGAHRYRVTQLGFSQSRQFLSFCGDVMAAAVSNLSDEKIAAGKGDFSLGEISLSEIGAAATDALRVMSDSRLEHLTKVLAAVTEVEAEPGTGKFVPLAVIMEIHFGRHMAEWVMWIVFCAQVNYSDFLGIAGDVLSQPLIPTA